MAILAQHSYTIRRLIDGKTLSLVLQSNRAVSQIYTPDPPTYVPDYGTSPFLVITPNLAVSGETGDQIAAGRLKAGSVAWKINGTAITTTNNATYNAQHTAAAPYALTIKKNMIDVAQLFIEFSGVYVQPITLVEIVISANITFSKTTNSGASIWAQAWASPGNMFMNDEEQTLQAKCELIRGSDSGVTNATFKWQRLISGTWTDINATNSPHFTGFNTHTMTVKAKGITNVERFKCVVTDTLAGSQTVGQTVASYVDFVDMSDPHQIDIELPKGDGIVTGGDVVVLTHVRQGGLLVPASFYTGKTIRHIRYNADGSVDSGWKGTGYLDADASRKITLTEADMKDGVKTAFGVELRG